MKTIISLIFIVTAATGCATLVPIQGNPGTAGSINSDSASSPSPMAGFPSQDENSGPRLIIPATGGPPVIGIPVGGGLFLPVTGGTPVIGIPISP
jgi:hypothetical protein